MIPCTKAVTLAIAEKRCPVPFPVDWVILGKAVEAAIECGYVRENRGCFDGWGGYSVTKLGRAILGTDSAT